MMLNMKAISTGGIIVANLGFSVVSLVYFLKRKKQEKPHPAATMTSHDMGSLIKVPSADVNQSILVTDYSDKRTIISMAWQMSYERLNEADGSDIESGRKAMLMVEAASDIRCALDCGTRCLLAKEGFNYMAEKLDDRIQQCSAYMNRVDIKKMQDARILCNRVIHHDSIYGNVRGQLQAAAKVPGALLHFLDTLD